jgi:hypothetical protein
MHRFSWDGISFLVPDEWDLSSYETNPTKSHVEMDDGTTRRIVAEWTRLPARFNALRIQQRYARAAKQFKKRATTSRDLTGLPKNWFATRYTMADANVVLAASYLNAEQRLFFSALLYFYKEELEKQSADAPAELLRSIAATVKIEPGPLVPWECYDFAFEINAQFRLAETAFLSGRKQMVFQWRQRRLYVFLISLADIVLRGRPVNEWAAEFLNSITGLRGPRFVAGKDGTITYKRRAVWPLGHADQIFRLCFRYKIGFEYDRDENKIFLWAYHYRRGDDLKKLEGMKWTVQKNKNER